MASTADTNSVYLGLRCLGGLTWNQRASIVAATSEHDYHLLVPVERYNLFIAAAHIVIP